WLRAGGFDRGRDAFDAVAEVVDVPSRVVVLDGATDRAGLRHAMDCEGGLFRLRSVAVLEIDGEREFCCLHQRVHVADDLVEGDAAVAAAKREGEAGARGRESSEAEGLERARRACIPG